MAIYPTFINCVNIALAEDTALVFLGAPAGGLAEGQVQEVEVLRLVMTFKMLREASAAFAAKVREVDAAERKTFDRTKLEEQPSFDENADIGLPVLRVAKH
jgi:hypothetical protein